MSLILRSVQKTPTFNFNKLRDDIIALRRILRVDRFELAVVCMDEPQLRELNKMYHQKDEPTDVLAFPRHQLAVTHGLCKLIGYRDDNLGQWRQMYDKEMDIIKKFNKATGSQVPFKPTAPPADNDLGPEEKKVAMSY